MPRYASKERAVLYEKLAQLQRAGTPLGEGLALLTSLGGVEDAARRRGLGELRAGLGRGLTLHEALRRTPPGAFSPLEQALLSAGEQHGRLDKSFADLAAAFQREYQARRDVVAGLAYPAFLLGMALVVPPLPTWYTAGSGAYLRAVWGGAWPLLFLGAALWLGVPWARRAAPAACDGLLLQVPVLGANLGKLAFARFCRALSALIGAGVELRRGTELAGGALGNQHLVAGSRAMTAALGAGQTLAEAMAAAAIFPGDLVERVAIGERSGTITETLDKAAEYYELEAQQALAMLLRALPIAAFLLIAARIAHQIIGFYTGYIDSIDRVLGSQ